MAAKAALLNAQAVINAERAWIVVSMEDEYPIPMRGKGPTAEALNTQENNRLAGERFKGTPTTYFISCKNHGRTPARITGGASGWLIVGNPMDDPPKSPDYSSPIVMPQQTFIVSDDGFRIHPGICPKSNWQNAKDQKKLKMGDLFVVCYGRIRYEDIFAFSGRGKRVQRESRWCFAFTPEVNEEPVNTGPEEYRCCT